MNIGCSKEELDKFFKIFSKRVKELDLNIGETSISLEDFLDNKQKQKLEKWLKKKKKVNTGAIGGRYTWQFTPTGIGYIITVKDNIKKDEIDLTDVENW
jgi:hypothetical protein